jgi:hypothetical protein
MYAFVIWVAAGSGMCGPFSLNVIAERWHSFFQSKSIRAHRFSLA